MEPIVIVGTGLAGYTVAREIRKLDKMAPLVLVTRDGGESYAKPMLSNAFAQNKSASDIASATSIKMAQQLAAQVMVSTTVDKIQVESKTILLGNGDAIGFAKLVLAIGADPIRVPIQGDSADKIISVNDLDDYARFREQLKPGCHVTIMGAGLIGCEFANDLVEAGFKVRVVDPADGPLGSLLPEQAAEFMQRRLSTKGVEWIFGQTVQAVDKAGDELRISLSSGEQFPSNLVLSAIGLRSRITLAKEAGLQVNRAIVVDIYAIGDCAEVQGIVLPFVMPIMHGARALAKSLLGQATAVQYPAMPVVVKTPACPCVVSPPGRGVAGAWKVEVDEDSVKALYFGVEQQLLGFALLGEATKQKQSLTKQLPAVLV